MRGGSSTPASQPNSWSCVVPTTGSTSLCRTLMPQNNSARVGSLRCARHSYLAQIISQKLLSNCSVHDDYKMNDPVRKTALLAPTQRRRTRRRTMKYICLGYYDKGKHERMTEAERNAMFDTCFEYDDHLRANGHWAGGEALQPPETALTVYWKNGKVATTDGPYAETKEQLGGILVLEARDMNHAVQLMAQHPALTYGNVFEIRPAADMNELMKASEQRRRQNTAR